MKIKTIDINAREWFDKINGNSYFSGTVCLNYGMPTEKSYDMPFQYGYGDHYIDMAVKLLKDKKEIYSDVRLSDLRDNVILRTHKQTGCRKRDL